MKRTVFPLIAIAALTTFALLIGRAAADDETDELEIKIHARLDAADCGATPPTISVLGLAIDVAAIGAEGENDCAALVVGQFVEVKLASDAPNPATGLLAAIAVESGDDGTVEVQAPLQGFDAGTKSITVLGRTVDASAATLEGAADEDAEGDWRLIAFGELMVGQSVEVKLNADQLPDLVATSVEVKNMSNEVDVELDDGPDNEVWDGDDDVDVSVTEIVMVQNPAGGRPRRVKKVVHFYDATRGSFILSGLPTGRAKILVTRTNGGVTKIARRRIKVAPNDSRDIVMRLHLPSH